MHVSDGFGKNSKMHVSGGFGKNSLISVGLSPFKSVISCFHVPLSAPTISVDVFLSFFFSGIKTGFLVPSLTLIFPSFKFNLTTRGPDYGHPLATLAPPEDFNGRRTLSYSSYNIIDANNCFGTTISIVHFSNHSMDDFFAVLKHVLAMNHFSESGLLSPHPVF